MSSTVGHALCGVSCWLLARQHIKTSNKLIGYGWLAGFVLLAGLPDLDFIAGYIYANNFHYFHSGPSHSIFGIIFTTAVIAMLWPVKRNYKLLAWIFIALATHVAIDLFTGPQPGLHKSYGVALFWPFTNERITMPVSLFYGVQHATFSDLVSWHNVKVMAIETLTFGLLLLFVYHWTRTPNFKAG